MKENLNHHYHKKEERINVLTHGFGFLLSIVALPFLVLKALEFKDFWESSSLVIFGLSMIILYGASTFYHASKEAKIRRKLNILDHAAIYVLIAGSYSPFCLIVVKSDLGWYMFLSVWIFALIGVVLKLFYTGKFDKISTFLYLLMGWQAMFFIKPLMNNLTKEGLYYLIAGGVFYTIGALFYLFKKITYTHAIFHVFVLLGTVSHFIVIYCL